MAMGYNRQSCMIEQSILDGTKKADDTLKQYRDRMRKKFEGRPHLEYYWCKHWKVICLKYNDVI
jgi:cytoplasmic iron level regulating protein YaaA (DUF328/UPF0246 family)